MGTFDIVFDVAEVDGSESLMFAYFFELVRIFTRRFLNSSPSS